MEFTIPVFDTEVDTSDPGDSAANVVGAVLGGVSLLGIVGVAQYAYNRMNSVAGTDNGFDIGGAV